MKIKDTNLTINVADIDQSISFYKSLGFELKQRWDNYYAQLTAPGLVIGLHPTGNDKRPGNSGNVSIGFTSDNLDETEKNLAESAIEYTQRSEEGGKFLHFEDPDGTALYFIEPKW